MLLGKAERAAAIFVGIFATAAILVHGQDAITRDVIPNQPNFVDSPGVPPTVVVDVPAAPPSISFGVPAAPPTVGVDSQAAPPTQAASPTFGVGVQAAPPTFGAGVPVAPPTFGVSVPVAPPAVVVDDACLSCICQASTGCKPLACHTAGPSQYFCGPYLISWAYWADAGKPSDDPNNPYAFEACLSDKECSERTIRAYMSRKIRDCDGDNRITCHDIARVHKAGPLGCHNQWVVNTDYWKIFLSCAALG